eukprot:GFKZ01000220.1.p1 GENE.GFKZ01000220.1~~GFKZ01000220.1.p1  ORF type:complete len:283 (+),score=37.51 GFKZ01000220.1:107-850(+)
MSHRTPAHRTWTSGIGQNHANPPQQNHVPSSVPNPGYADPRRRHVAMNRYPLSAPDRRPISAPPPSMPTNPSDGLPDPPSTFPELEALSLKDLRLLNDEKAKFDDFVSKHKHQAAVNNVLARIRADVDNFEREHEAVTKKMEEDVDDNRLAELREGIACMQQELDELNSQKDQWMEKNSPERLMERLRAAIAESESASESLTKSMLSSSISFEEFLRQYIVCRRKYHERYLKLEQLKQEARRRTLGR